MAPLSFGEGLGVRTIYKRISCRYKYYYPFFIY